MNEKPELAISEAMFPHLRRLARIAAQELGYIEFEDTTIARGRRESPIYYPIMYVDSVDARLRPFRWFSTLLEVAGSTAEIQRGSIYDVERAHPDLVRWIQSSEAVKRFLAFADERERIIDRVHEVMVAERKINLGVYRGVEVYIPTNLKNYGYHQRQEKEIGAELLELARLYIDAAISLIGDKFDAKDFDASYGWNNHWYLIREFFGDVEGEELSLQRVFVPFSGGNTWIDARLAMTPEEIFMTTAEVRKLIDWGNPIKDWK